MLVSNATTDSEYRHVVISSSRFFGNGKESLQVSETTKQIGFRGTEDYREMLQRAALDRRMKVQGMIEAALAAYLSADSQHAATPVPPSQIQDRSGVPSAEHGTGSAPNSDMLSGLSAEDRAAVDDIVRIFREGSGLKAVLLSGVSAWREMKRESQSIRAVEPKATAKKLAV